MRIFVRHLLSTSSELATLVSTALYIFDSGVNIVHNFIALKHLQLIEFTRWFAPVGNLVANSGK